MKQGELFLVVFGSILILNNHAAAQDFQNMEFGKVGIDNFQVSAPKFDSGASAVVIKDFGKTEYVGNESGFFSIHYKRFIRVKIVSKNGFHAADFRILLHNYKVGSYEKITDVKGTTFNLENGLLQQTKLDPKSVYSEKYNRYYDLVKFTMPALKEGSIFDLTYSIETNYFSDPPEWTFQRNYPCLWSEYQATIPSCFHYFTRIRGNDSFDIKTSEALKQNFTIRSGGADMSNHTTMSVRGTSFQYRWVKKNVPVLQEQPYISKMDNYNSRISFELDYFQQDERSEKELQRATWSRVSYGLLLNENFGFELNLDNHWMDAELSGITAGALNSEEEIKRIFNYVKNNFNCTDFDDIYIRSSLKNVFNKRSGNVAELNLLLVAMLRHQNIKADPAILSTRSNGIATQEDPMLQEYNYLICIAQTTNKIFELDAANVLNPFNTLPAYCYNWGARVINTDHPDFIMLSPDSISEMRVTNAIFANDDNGVSSGSVTTRYGNNQAFDIREKVKKTSLKEYFDAEQLGFSEMKVSNLSFDSLNRTDFPLVLHYDLDFKDLKAADLLYFNPVLGPSFEKNPFVLAERQFPVEMSSKIDYSYTLSMEIPKGFQVDELPKSARINLIETKGNFEYLIQQAGGYIQMRVHLKLNEATFNPDEYGSLRDFFAFVVKKENEQIVFKKIK